MSLDFVLQIVILFIVLVLAILIFLIIKKKSKRAGKSGLDSGSVFDSFNILSFIKRGGMSSVYKATNIKTGDVVALKIMHESLMEDSDLVDKFLREGDILEQLNRKYPDAPIVKVYRNSRENNSPNGRPFIALELVEGIDLDNVIATQNLSIEHSVEIIRNILFALKCAHKEGILHRDISPGNIMVNFVGGQLSSIKVIDFGVAKNEYMNKHTPDSSIHGKPPFMSPEQCRNEKLDNRTDLYSLGVLFFTLITGSPPFMSKNPLEVMSMHQNDDLPPLPDSLPADVKMIIMKLLEKDPANRYQTADSVLKDLNASNLLDKEIKDGKLNHNIAVEEEIEFTKVDPFAESIDLKKMSQNDNKSSNSSNKVKVTSILVGLLFIALLGFFVNEITTSHSSFIGARINDPINKVVKKLREEKININYHFVSKQNLKSGHFAKLVMINTDTLAPGKYVDLYINE